MNIYCVVVTNETTMIPHLMNLGVPGRKSNQQKDHNIMPGYVNLEENEQRTVIFSNGEKAGI